MAAEVYDPKKDEMFKKPYIDIEEKRGRQLTDGREIEFLYVHGGFSGTNVRFSFCFPDKAQYEGRFYQYLSPFPGPEEELASLVQTGWDDKIGFALTHGAYFVESNMGAEAQFTNPADVTLLYRSSAAVAEYSRTVAQRIYGAHRVYGYVYGGSGGGYKTMDCIERTSAFDGAVPYVIGSPVALPNCLTVRVHGLRVLRHKFPQIIDALEPGGSGDVYAGLSDEERAVLKEITAMGFPQRSWFAYKEMGDGSLPVLAPGVAMGDPEYFQDFWTKPGYLGTEAGGSALRDRLQFRAKVTAVHIPGYEKKKAIDDRNGVDTAWQKMLSSPTDDKAWIELEAAPEGDDLYLEGVNIILESGRAKGSRMLLDTLDGKRLLIGMCFGMDDVQSVLKNIQPGDQVYLDNSDYIAIQSYHRHNVPDRQFKVWDQYRDSEGNPLYPQRRKKLFGHIEDGQSGRIQGKVIVLSALMDESAYAWQADWYRKRVELVNGESADEKFRLWYVDNCYHGDQEHELLDPLHLVPYLGMLRQALLDVAQWVEKGIEPAPSSNYTVEDGQVLVPEDADQRGGLQPVVTLLANGSKCACVAAGESVQFEAQVKVPGDTGKVTEVLWSFEGEREFGPEGTLERSTDGKQAVAAAEHIYKEPGTYFAVAHVRANRNGSLKDAYTQIRNLDRVRVIVS